MSNKPYKVRAYYFSSDLLEAARDNNQRIIEIWCGREEVIEVEFEYFREFEKENFLTSIKATPSKQFINAYEV